MKINVAKLILIYLCILVISCTCFQKHIQAITSKMNELFGKKLCNDDNKPLVFEVNQDKLVVPQCDKTNNKHYLFGIDWRSIRHKIANNWWIIAVSSLMPFILFWRIQYNMRKKLHEWKKIIIQKEKAHSYSRSRRLTLPDLTLAKHVRRESLADTSLKVINRPRKLSQCNILQFRNTRKNSFERSEDSSSGEVKRAHLIRRRH